MTDLERLAGALDVMARRYMLRCEKARCGGNELSADYLEGRSAGLTQAAGLLRRETLKRAETDEEEAG